MGAPRRGAYSRPVPPAAKISFKRVAGPVRRAFQLAESLNVLQRAGAGPHHHFGVWIAEPDDAVLQ
jgi:hypothetical protein